MTLNAVAAADQEQRPAQLAAVPGTARRSIDRLWAVCSFVAGVLIVVAAFLPLWKLELVAPQYPKGLFVTAYGYDMTGDIGEINQLNHYVGLRPLKPENVVELKLFPFGVAGILAVVLLSAYRSRSRKLRFASAAAAWSLPTFTLLDLQYWLYRQGHDIDPDAALTVEPFTPRVLGSTEVLNFHSVGTVSTGFWLLIAAAVLLTAGPWAVRFLRDSWNNTGKVAAAAAAIGLLAFIGAEGAATPATASAAGSIADAISRAAPGDTVRIGPGTYREQLVIDKPLTLIGEGWPVIDGGRKGDVVVIAAEWVTLRGFVIQGFEIYFYI